MHSKHLPDTQNTTDVRNSVLNEVGIKDISHPINFINRDQESLPSVANFKSLLAYSNAALVS